jgi:membrane protease YdiL (CAAX protease family)
MAQRYIYALILIFLAVFFWLEMFALKHYNFWIEMLIAASFLAIISIYINHRAGAEINYRLYFFKPSYVLAGIISAAILYGVFFAGDRLSALLFDFAGKQISGIYGNKTLLDSYIIALLLFFIIGPAEEIFWRGFVQDSFAHQFGENSGWILASAVYASVHIVALNFMLFAAALICGLFWGYMFKHYKTLWPGIISHALWDVTIFVLLPVR